MGHVPFTGGDTYDEGDFQTLMDQVVPYYASYATMAAAISSPVEGQLANVAGSLHGYTGSAWRRITTLGYPTAKSAQASGQTVTAVGSGSRVDITGCTLSMDVVKNVTVVATLTLDGQMTADDGEVAVVQMSIGGSIQTGSIVFGNSERMTTSVSWLYTPASTTTLTFKGTAYLNNGSGANLQVNAGGTGITVWWPNPYLPAAP